MVEGPSPVPAGAAAGVLAEPEPDRAAVEVPQEEGPEPLARDVRGDAGGGGRGAGSTGRLPGRVGDADDGAVCDRGGRAGRGARRGTGRVPPGRGVRSRRPQGECVTPSGMTDVAHDETSVKVSTSRHTTLQEVLDRRRYRCVPPGRLARVWDRGWTCEPSGNG